MIVTTESENSGLPPFLLISLGVHLLAVIAFAIGTNAFSVSSLDRKKKLNFVKIPRAVRVDVVAMPRYTLQELKKIQVAPKEAEVVKEKPAPAKKVEAKKDFLVKGKKKSKKDFLNMLKNLGNKMGEKKSAEDKEKKLKAIAQKHLKDLVLAGNKLSTGTSAYGDVTTGEIQNSFSRYILDLPNHIKPFWTLPPYLATKELRCRIRIFLTRSGYLIKSEFVEQSGDDEYDKLAMSAIKKALPFPSVTGEIEKRVEQGDIVLGFPL